MFLLLVVFNICMNFKKVGVYLIGGGFGSLALALILGFSIVILPAFFGCGLDYAGGICDLFYSVFPLITMILVIIAGLLFFVFTLLMLYHSIAIKKEIIWAIAIFFVPFVQYIYYYLYIYKDKKEEKKK